MPHGASSTRRTSANASSACFEAAYGPRKGSALRPPIEPMRTTRPRALPQRGQKRLHHGDLADDVHLELAAELVERDELERRRDRDPGVVDEAVAAPAPTATAAAAICSVSVTSSWSGSTPRAAQRIRVLGGAHAAVDPPTGAAQTKRARLPDPRRGSGDEDRELDELNRRGSSRGAPRARARTSRARRAPSPRGHASVFVNWTSR